jgi:hypothetical protein
VNFLTAEEGEDRVRAAYKDNFDRLARIKAAYDPDNLFRSNKNITAGKHGCVDFGFHDPSEFSDMLGGRLKLGLAWGLYVAGDKVFNANHHSS